MPAICERHESQETFWWSENGLAVDLVGLQEITELFGEKDAKSKKRISRQLALAWSKLEHFPEPVAELAQGRVWRRTDVLRWARKYEPARRRLS